MIVARQRRKISLCHPEATGIHSVASTVSLAILRLRDRQRMSQTELARRAGISRTHLSEIEAGREGGRGILLVTVMRLARALDTTVDELLGYRVCSERADEMLRGAR